MNKEAKARIKINKLLEDAGWRFFASEKGPANIQLENNVTLTQKLIDDFGEDFEKVSKGFIDYLLLDNKGFPVCVLKQNPKTKTLSMEKSRLVNMQILLVSDL